VNRQLLSDGCRVHIAKKYELTALLAAADNGNVEVLHEMQKHRACVIIVIKKCSVLLKAAAEKRNT